MDAPVGREADMVLLQVRMGDHMVWVSVEVLPVDGEGACVFWAPAPFFCSRNRPVGGYNDCTWYHLPVWNCSPPCPRKADAIFAIFAARIALSSLDIRSRAR